jgi:hypothetical protein
MTVLDTLAIVRAQHPGNQTKQDLPGARNPRVLGREQPSEINLLDLCSGDCMTVTSLL